MTYIQPNPNGQATMANSSPVVIASDQSAVPVSAASLPLPSGAATETTLASVETKVGSLTETAPATDTASSGLNGRLQRIAQRITSLIALLPAALGTGGGIKVDGSGTALPISVASVPLPTGAATETTLGTRLSESDFDTKIGSLTETAPATDIASSGLNGRLQRIAQRITSLIALLPAALGAGGGIKVDGSGTALPISVASVPSHPVTNAGTFAVQATEADGANVTLGSKADAKSTATDTTAITIMQVLKQISASVQAPPSQAVTFTGSTDVATQTTLATRLSESDFDTKTGSLTETAPATDTASSGLNGRLQRIAQRITSLIALLPTALGSGGGLKVDGSGTALPVSMATNTPVGNVAHDAADSGAPIKVGGRARSSEIAAVASDDRVDAVYDLVGKQIVLPYANPENFVSGAITSAMTSTTSTSLIAAPASGLRNYITTIIVSNAHATVGTDVIIQDGSGGTTLMTIPAAAVYGGAVINLPVPLRQPTTATAIYCANVTTGASTKVSAVGYKGV